MDRNSAEKIEPERLQYLAWRPGQKRINARRYIKRIEWLTPREREVLSAIAEGYFNSEICAGMFISESTLKFHLKNIFRKLGVMNRVQASLILTEYKWSTI